MCQQLIIGVNSNLFSDSLFIMTSSQPETEIEMKLRFEEIKRRRYDRITGEKTTGARVAQGRKNQRN